VKQQNVDNSPKTQKAAVAMDDKTVKFAEVPVPELNEPDDVLIKVYSVAQNPTDWKSVAQGRTAPGRIVGNDIAGVVVAVDKVTNVKVGDRVVLPVD